MGLLLHLAVRQAASSAQQRITARLSQRRGRSVVWHIPDAGRVYGVLLYPSPTHDSVSGSTISLEQIVDAVRTYGLSHRPERIENKAILSHTTIGIG